jgi:acetolactate synthase-1/2/3 large subunit
MIVADYIAEELVTRGIRHVFGVGGANIEDLFAAVQRRRPRIQAVLGKHEHAAGTAADAYARIGRGLGVVMVTSGGGAMNLVHALAEASASRVPLLALVGEPPTDLQGRGAFQDTSGREGAVDAAEVFEAVSRFCARLERPEGMPELLEAAVQAATGPRPGPAVLLLAKDLQRAEIPAGLAGESRLPPRPAAEIDHTALRRAAALLAVRPVVVVAGDEIARAGARGDLVALVRALDARVAVAPDARDAFDNRDPRFLGVAGAMGHAAVAPALAEARVCLLAGTRLPLLARQGLEPLFHGRPLVAVGCDPPFLTGGAGSLHVPGDLRTTLAALAAELATSEPPASTLPPLAPLVPCPDVDPSFGSASILRAIEASLPDDGVVLIDAGNTGAQAVHHLRAPRRGRWLIAMGMAGMGWTFGAAVGAALASGRRCTVLAGDGAFFMNGLDVHTALEHALPITYVIFNNRAHGMCLVRERLLLGGETGTNAFRHPCYIGAGLAAMFPGLHAQDCFSLDETTRAVARAAASAGPAVICADLPGVEVPPFVAFQQAIATAAVAGGRP